MSKSKSKTFQSDHDGPIAVAVPGTASSINFEPGDTYETDDPAEIESLSANTDVSEVKGGSKKNERS